jgi:hypothetical protein
VTSVVLGTLSGTITYNGVQLTNLHTSKFRGRVEYTSDGRTIAGIIWTLEVEFIVSEANEGACDSVMANLETKLMARGKPLLYDGKGSGLGAINATTDLGWGPKPMGFDATPMGGNQAYIVRWSIEWMASACTATAGFIEATWTMEMASDGEGFMRRTVTGFVRRSANGTFRNLDAGFVDGAIPVPGEGVTSFAVQGVPIGWRRVSATRQMTPDTLAINYSIVDAEERILTGRHRRR